MPQGHVNGRAKVDQKQVSILVTPQNVPRFDVQVNNGMGVHEIESINKLPPECSQAICIEMSIQLNKPICAARCDCRHGKPFEKGVLLCMVINWKESWMALPQECRV
jgi:hypothetical protein